MILCFLTVNVANLRQLNFLLAQRLDLRMDFNCFLTESTSLRLSYFSSCTRSFANWTVNWYSTKNIILFYMINKLICIWLQILSFLNNFLKNKSTICSQLKEHNLFFAFFAFKNPQAFPIKMRILQVPCIKK